jgi:hypothetical protein
MHLRARKKERKKEKEIKRKEKEGTDLPQCSKYYCMICIKEGIYFGVQNNYTKTLEITTIDFQ